MLVSASVNQLLNDSLFTRQENHVLKGATIKEKIFFPLRVAPMGIENYFKRHQIEKCQN